MASGALISAEEAVRRVLILENPGLPGQASITQKPVRRPAADPARRDRAQPPPHPIRAALHRRGRGAYTAVNGERTTMRPGDFIITPSWTWHDHGNADSADGGEPVVWLDGLDIPLLRFLDAGFAENYPRPPSPSPAPRATAWRATATTWRRCATRRQAAPRRSSTTRMSAAAGAGPALPPRRAGPLGRRQAALPEPGHGRLSHAHHGHLHAAPARRLPGQDQPLHRLHRLLRGGGPRHGPHRRAGIPFGPRDVFVAPSWQPLRLAALEDATLFSYSDRPVQAIAGRLARSARRLNARPPRAFPFSDSPASEG